MTRDETKALIRAISGLYPSFKPEDPTLMVDMWTQVLADYPLEAAKQALLIYARENVTGFAPTPGNLIQITSRKYTSRIGELEAWELVKKAIRNGSYHSEEEFEKLPQEIRKAIGAPSYLRDRAMDENYNEAVEASNFARAYRTILDRQREEISGTPYAALKAPEETPLRVEDKQAPREDNRANIDKVRSLVEQLKEELGA